MSRYVFGRPRVGSYRRSTGLHSAANLTDMATNGEFTTLVIGLPGAGKTTFLAALWHVLMFEPNAGLVVTRLPPVRDHLNAIAASWLRCETLPRTTLSTEQTASIALAPARSKGPALTLVFPDYAGEKFVQQWSHREWDAEYAELVSRADAILLFINPEKHVLAPTIADALPLAAVIGADLAQRTQATVTEWDPSLVPHDVQLVDLLQSVLLFSATSNPEVCVVISAWDVVKATGATPHAWLRQNSPLLSQFLDARLKYGVFGVSGQGGNLPVDADRLLEILNPTERIEVVSDHPITHDITVPIQYLLRMA